MGYSLRKAINDKCRDCTFDPQSGDGTWGRQVDACTITSCALHPVRRRIKRKPIVAGVRNARKSVKSTRDGTPTES